MSIHILPTKAPKTIRNLVPQQPSWKIEAAVFLARITQSTITWKHARTKLILMIAEGPRQAAEPPDSSGHYRYEGKTSTMCLAVKSNKIDTKIQNAWKNTKPTLAKFFD